MSTPTRTPNETQLTPKDTSTPHSVTPGRRNLSAEMSGAVPQGVVTRSKTQQLAITSEPTICEDDFSLHTMIDTSWTSEENDPIICTIMHASLQSDPQYGVPKNYKELLQLNDQGWIDSLNAELDNFLSRDAWEFLPRKKLPANRKTLRCRWIFKQKADGSKKSRNVVRGYEQTPGIKYTESYSPLATNTTI